MWKGNIYTKYPAQMVKRMEKIYYEVGKAAFEADRIEQKEEDQKKIQWKS